MTYKKKIILKNALVFVFKNTNENAICIQA